MEKKIMKFHNGMQNLCCLKILCCSKIAHFKILTKYIFNQLNAWIGGYADISDPKFLKVDMKMHWHNCYDLIMVNKWFDMIVILAWTLDGIYRWKLCMIIQIGLFYVPFSIIIAFIVVIAADL